MEWHLSVSDTRSQTEFPPQSCSLIWLDFRNVEQEVLYESSLFNPSRSPSLKSEGS
jgi:hypothetical protein